MNNLSVLIRTLHRFKGPTASWASLKWPGWAFETSDITWSPKSTLSEIASGILKILKITDVRIQSYQCVNPELQANLDQHTDN